MSGRIREGALSADRTPTNPPAKPRLVPLSPTPTLTKQQRLVLRAVAHGQRLDAIEGISYETARTHMKAAKKRLGCHTAAHAASKAILRGLI